MTQAPPKIGNFDDTIGRLDCVVNAKARQEYIDHAVRLKLPFIVPHKKRKGKVAIVGSGPSATDYVDLLKEWNGEIWGINRSFEWMRHRGIKPTAFLGIDPEPVLKDCLLHTPDDVTYYLATQVHPNIYDYLKGKKIKLWCMADSEVKHPFGAIPVYGGTTCLTRAPNLAWILGYREVHIFGGDSSYTHKTHVHGGELPPVGVIPAEVNGVFYKTTKAMMSQACEFAEQMVEWARQKDPLSVSIYGDGLMQALVAASMNAGGYEQYIIEEARKELVA